MILKQKNNKELFKICISNMFEKLTKRNMYTGLYSINYFFYRLENKKNGTFMMAKFMRTDFVNLSSSSSINSNNEAIKLVTKNIKEVDEKCIITRLSHTEFALYTTITNIDTIKSIMNNIILDTNNASKVSRTLKISVNVAAIIYDKDDFDVDDAKDKIQLSISDAIRRGINKYELYNERYNSYINIDTIEKAIDDGDIVLYYQPKVDIKSKKIKGVEALIRWFSKEHGYISPDKLIGFAEDSGYITVLGKWIIKKACEEIKYINDNLKEKIDLSVNISSIQLESETFLEEIESIIKETEFEKELLKLEITESRNLESIEKIKEVLDGIKKSGIKLSIDDFGKGYNSIDYIKNYDVDEIKIDKSLVEYLGSNPIFIKNLINMIHTTNALVVAEGVERSFEYETLLMMECDLVQGYYFYKPMDSKQLFKIIKDEVV